MPVVIVCRGVQPHHGKQDSVSDFSYTLVTGAESRVRISSTIEIEREADRVVNSWPCMPRLMAGLRAVTLPVPGDEIPQDVQQSACLEIVDSMLGADGPETIFSAQAASDIVRYHRDIIAICPCTKLAQSILDNQEMDAGVFFQYIDSKDFTV
jgi:hypothetical protein